MPPTAVTSEIITPLAAERPPGHKGAFAEEIGESRIGLQTGLQGAQNVTRIFRVYTVNRTDNPVKTLEDLSTRYGGVKVGSAFPTTGGWGDGSYVLYYFTLLDHWVGTNVWIVQAHYVPSYVTAFATNAWSFAIGSSIEMVRVLTDLDGKGIGAPKYKEVSTGRFSTTSVEHGSRFLELPSLNDTPFSPGLPRYLTGADTPTRLSTLTLTKRIDSWRMDAVIDALNGKRFINSDEFMVVTTSGEITFVDAPANDDEGKMLFSDIQLNETVNPTGGNVPAFQVTMTFKYNPDGWQEKRQHFHRWHDGSESPITQGGEPVIETWRINGSTSLSAIVGAFN